MGRCISRRWVWNHRLTSGGCCATHIIRMLRKILPSVAAMTVMIEPFCQAERIYFNDFSGPPGCNYSEWSSSAIRYSSATGMPKSGLLPPPPVTNCVSPNGAQRFLGEFGGPVIATPADANYMQVRVEQTITL